MVVVTRGAFRNQDRRDFLKSKLRRQGGRMNDAKTDPLPIQIEPTNRLLTAAEFQNLAELPLEVEWFASLSNPNTRRAYEPR